MKSILLFCGALVLCTLFYSTPSYCQGVIIKGGINYSDFHYTISYSNWSGNINEIMKVKAKAGYNIGVSADLLRSEDESFLALTFSPYYVHYSIYTERRHHNEFFGDTLYYNYNLSKNAFVFPISLKYLWDFNGFKIGPSAGVSIAFGEHERKTFNIHYGLEANYRKFAVEFLCFKEEGTNSDEGENLIRSLSFNIGYIIY